MAVGGGSPLRSIERLSLLTGEPRTSGRPNIGRTCLRRAVLTGSVQTWNKLGPCAALASSRDFGTAGTCRRPRIALARFSRSRPTEAAFVFHALADPNVADGEAASNLGGDA